jgi:regulator of sigma D
MKLKAEHFQVYDLVTAQNTGNQDSILGRLICILFRIMQHREIFILNFNTQLAIIHVFHFINCFLFLIPNELTKYQAT